MTAAQKNSIANAYASFAFAKEIEIHSGNAAAARELRAIAKMMRRSSTSYRDHARTAAENAMRMPKR